MSDDRHLIGTMGQDVLDALNLEDCTVVHTADELRDAVREADENEAIVFDEREDPEP